MRLWHLVARTALVFIVFQAWSAEASSQVLDLCALESRLVSAKILPELETGLSKRIALLGRQGEASSMLREAQLKKDLWKNLFLVKILPDGPEEVYKDVAALEGWVCRLLTFPTKDLPAATGEVLLLLNPNNEATAKLMDDWTRRNAGVYKNLGLRLRWDSLADVDKAQKILLRHRLPGA